MSVAQPTPDEHLLVRFFIVLWIRFNHLKNVIFAYYFNSKA